MGLVQKLNYLLDTKKLIKQAIINKNVEVKESDTFRSYASKIDNINQGIITESSLQSPNVSYSVLNQFLVTESEAMKISYSVLNQFLDTESEVMKNA